ncbi:MAG: DUF4159 domain-containing protein [Magnetospirillum sp.]|nr:DUF4159 domain-containing protein [Magnetospirillum sp.]
MGLLSSFAFLAPVWLAALAALPVLWWLLRVTPPAPRRAAFPAIALLLRVKPGEETPAQTPWWLLLLRLLIAGLIILALAQPVLNPAARIVGGGPTILVVDDGWASAANWSAMRAHLDRALDGAERDQRAVMLLATAPNAAGEPPRPSRLLTAGEARPLVGALEPKPWPVDRVAARATLEAVAPSQAALVQYFSDGLEDAALPALLERLQRIGPVVYTAPTAEKLARLMLPPVSETGGIAATVARASTAGPLDLNLVARGEDGRLLAREILRFEAGNSTALARISLPSELRNRISRLEIEGEATAAATALIDERWRRRPVGIVSSDTAERQNQPLLADTFYLERALQPFSEVRIGTVADILARETAVLILADVGELPAADRAAVEAWLRRGGVVLRFAGARLAEANDDLVPVPLRLGGRAFGGAMSWEQPIGLAPFDVDSPFVGLDIPADVLVRRQVLAEPTLELARKSWARLSDGTPLVTADKRGEGWLVLVHVTASPEWSDLPLSGLYIEMLQRLIALAQGVAGDGAGDALLAPVATLDAFGRLVSPFPAAAGVPSRSLAATLAAPRTPPGQYGTQAARRALNLSQGLAAPRAATSLPSGITRAAYDGAEEVDFKPTLFVLALLLLVADIAVALALRGLLSVGPLRNRLGAILVFGALALGSTDATQAQTRLPPVDDATGVANSLATHLAFVRTGDEQIDRVSRAGLAGLGVMLARRTAVDPGTPVGVDLERDELAFYPLLYWPVASHLPLPSADAMARVKQYMANGGMVLFDTREADFIGPAAGGPSAQRLRDLLRPLDLPRLVRVPAEHVLTKTFYLMQDFPGRLTGAPVWIEQPDARDKDGVTSIVIGANDWAGAWALDAAGRPMFAAVPGGDNQREFAVRFGINLVMYALTGNYKGDQVHVDTILERLRR